MLRKTAIDLVKEARESAATCTAEEAVRRVADGARLLDVREPPEFATASISVAVPIPRGVLEFKIAEICPDPAHPILIHCASGGRAFLAARTLSEMGYAEVCVVAAPFEELVVAFEASG